MTFAPGTRVGPYEIVALLGAGGMGEVYRARDGRLARDIALKVLPRNLAAHPESRERLLREARAAAALSHPNICTIHHIDEHAWMPGPTSLPLAPCSRGVSTGTSARPMA